MMYKNKVSQASRMKQGQCMWNNGVCWHSVAEKLYVYVELVSMKQKWNMAAKNINEKKKKK